ncbi:MULTISPECIES: glycine cleavage system protein GcvH [Carboxydothermus]|uniref:Glycine cleavage system H protein n=2 Tax=Carboxydothermus TaxID=129957 RepID=GCSH_CARHZ|nr:MULTISPECIES: glycine cleavage system protein GcvH [Carboxydothermus]Q3AET6.1 RecName: Full=Glycine cleavage system H protein [Carboxydothermus hydrogenoformans Z-2901]ABB15449.1 glycine cleavage system H protein [Carboxydothermus hydrogenoformans Z-2901]NYE56368.1 glycine cleavage system H protein [Carboxydothermus ferrireducens DSM 11255]
MSVVPKDLKYSREHEWIKVDGNIGIIGITDFAQKSLGDIVFIELPGVGDEISAGDSFGVVESVKAASDLYAPVSGKVVEVNEEVIESPQLVNEDPYGKGWMIKVEISNEAELDELLSPEDYEKLLEEEGE